MRWRDRLVLLVMRLLVPKGIAPQNVPMIIGLDSGQSTPEDPKLCLRVRLAGTNQPIVSIVLDPGMAVWWADAFASLHEWADEGRQE